MPARIAAIRVQNRWSVRAPDIHCNVRLTRPLTPEELALLDGHPRFSANGDVIFFTCRPEEVEETEQQLAALLRQIHEAADEVLMAERSAPVAR